MVKARKEKSNMRGGIHTLLEELLEATVDLVDKIDEDESNAANLSKGLSGAMPHNY